jgi:hypothetical protein
MNASCMGCGTDGITSQKEMREHQQSCAKAHCSCGGLMCDHYRGENGKPHCYHCGDRGGDKKHEFGKEKKMKKNEMRGPEAEYKMRKSEQERLEKTDADRTALRKSEAQAKVDALWSRIHGDDEKHQAKEMRKHEVLHTVYGVAKTAQEILAKKQADEKAAQDPDSKLSKRERLQKAASEALSKNAAPGFTYEE